MTRVVLVALVMLGLVAWPWCTGGPVAVRAGRATRRRRQKARLIGFALNRRSVPAWQISMTDLGFTPETRS